MFCLWPVTELPSDRAGVVVGQNGTILLISTRLFSRFFPSFFQEPPLRFRVHITSSALYSLFICIVLDTAKFLFQRKKKKKNYLTAPLLAYKLLVFSY